MEVSLLVTILAMCTFFKVSAQPFGVDTSTIENMQKKKSSCIELSEEKEDEIKIIVLKLTDHLHQVMQEHNKFDFKLIKLNIEEHKDTHTTENDTVLQVIVNDCARENKDDTKTDEKLNRNNITKAEPKKDDGEAKKHDLSSVGAIVDNKDSKTHPNHEVNNQPTVLIKKHEQSSKLNDSFMPSFNHGEAHSDKKPSMTKLKDSTKPLSNGTNFGKKLLPTDKNDNFLNGPKKANENTDKLKDTKKSFSNNYGPNFGIKSLDKRDNITNNTEKNNENADNLKDTIKPLSNNHGSNLGKQPLATDKSGNVTNDAKKNEENTENLKEMIKPLSNNHGSNLGKQPLATDKRVTKDEDKRDKVTKLKDTIKSSHKDGAIDKKKVAIDGITKKNDDKQNKTTEEKHNEKEAKITVIEPKLNQNNETYPEIKKNENKENVTKNKGDKKNEEQMKKPGPNKNEKDDDDRDKELTQLKLPDSAEKLLSALEKNQPEGKPVWVYVEETEDKKNIVFS